MDTTGVGTTIAHRCDPIRALQPNLATAAQNFNCWVRQMLCQVRRWLPQRTVVVADSSFAVELLEAATQMPLPILVTRLRLDAALYHPAPPQTKAMGQPRKVGKRLPTLKTILDDAATVWQTMTWSVVWGTIL